MDVVVVGAGLSGLATALLLAERGHSVRIVEARDRPGGRVRSVIEPSTQAFLGDLGPTWVWPAYQPLIQRWITQLELDTFPQFTAGHSIFDVGPDTSPELCFLPEQLGSVRVRGGTQAIVDSIIARLPAVEIVTNSLVTSVSMSEQGGCIYIDNGHATLEANCVVIAVPPRIALNSIAWCPSLRPALSQALGETPTWMAPHAKLLAVYDEPFWRQRGLSGRIASRVGPIAEAHDHCAHEGMPAAIFGFLGWPVHVRREAGVTLERQVRAQLKRCFGSDSRQPKSIHIEEWATDPLVASPRDLVEPMGHPEVGPNILREPHCQGRLWFAGAETASRSPGLIEGAFDAAERVASAVSESFAASSMKPERS